MKAFIIKFSLLSLIGLFSCSKYHSSDATQAENKVVAVPQQEAVPPVDTSSSFRIGHYWVTPDSLFDFNTLIKSGEDTLHIASCQKYVLDPFEPIKNEAQLQSSLLKSFAVKTMYLKEENGTFPILVLTKGNNKLLLYFEIEPDASTSSYVFQGEINDSSVVFANHVRVGMPAGSFYRQFFTVFPSALQRKYKTVVFDYCVDGIRHIYDIKNGRLTDVKFSQPGSFWKVDY